MIDMKNLTEKVKEKLGTAEEPFEGAVPNAKVEEEVIAMIEASKGAAKKSKFVFDSYIHEKDENFVKFIE